MEVVVLHDFSDKTEALHFENHIKKQKSRAYIESLIYSADNEFTQ